MSEDLRTLIEELAYQAAKEYGLDEEEAYEMQVTLEKVVDGEITG